MKIRSSPMMSTNDELWSNATTLTKFNLGSSILDEYEKETQLFYPFSEKNDHHILHQSSTTEGDNNSDSPKKLKVYKEENHKLNTEQNPSESEQGSALINDDSSFKLLDELSLKFNAETNPNPGNQHIDSECQHIKCHQVECQYNEHQYVKRKQVQCKHVKCQNIECQHVKSQQHLSLEGDGISKGTGVEDPGSQQTTTKRQHIVETKGYIVSGIAIRGDHIRGEDLSDCDSVHMESENNTDDESPSEYLEIEASVSYTYEVIQNGVIVDEENLVETQSLKVDLGSQNNNNNNSKGEAKNGAQNMSNEETRLEEDQNNEICSNEDKEPLDVEDEEFNSESTKKSPTVHLRPGSSTKRKILTEICPHCDKMLAKYTLKRHLVACTGQTKVPEYMGPNCSLVTINKSNLVRHYKAKHGGCVPISIQEMCAPVNRRECACGATYTRKSLHVKKCSLLRKEIVSK